jgi:hypothetical protein
MFRKFAIALGASAVIAAAALSPTAASAHGGHHWHHGWGGGLYVGLYPGYVGPDCYTVRKVVWTRHGKRVRYYEVCD